MDLLVLLEEMKGASSSSVWFGVGVVLGQAEWAVWKMGVRFSVSSPIYLLFPPRT